MSQYSEHETEMTEAVSRMVGGNKTLNYFTHLHEEIGFIYFSAPAVANIRTTASLNLAVAETLGVKFGYQDLGAVYKRQSSIVAGPKGVGPGVFAEMLDDPDVVKLTFLRDPVERFAALYRRVFSINTMRARPRVQLFGHLGIPVEENLSMLDLAELLCEEEELKLQLPHLRSQRQMAAFDLVDYSFIGRHETWEDDFSRISQEIFGRDVAQFDPIKVFNQDPEGVELQGNVDAETRAALEEAYREDYEMLEEVDELFPGGFAGQSG